MAKRVGDHRRAISGAARLTPNHNQDPTAGSRTAPAGEAWPEAPEYASRPPGTSTATAASRLQSPIADTMADRRPFTPRKPPPGRLS